MVNRLLLMFVVLRPLAAPDTVVPVEGTKPGTIPLPRDAWTPPPPLRAAELPTRRLVVRFAPAAGWSPSPDAWEAPDLMELLTPPEEAWPEGDPVLDALYDGLVGDDDDTFLQLADADGLLDHDPSTYDDEWTRFAALWAMYGEATARAEWFLQEEDARALRDEVQASLDRAPDGDTSDALHLAWLVLDDSDEPSSAAREHVEALLGSADPDVRSVGLRAVHDDDTSDLHQLLEHPDVRDGHLGPLVTALELAVAQQAWAEASALTEQIAEHPEASPELRRDVEQLDEAVAEPPPAPPWDVVVRAARSCADVGAGDTGQLQLVAGVLLSLDDEPLSWCLDGMSVAAPDQRVELRLTR